MLQARSALPLWALLLAFSAPALAQTPGFSDLTISGSPVNVSTALPLDVDGDGITELVVAHDDAVSSLEDADLYFDANGDAIARELIDSSYLVKDITSFRSPITAPAGELVSVGATGLTRWTWNSGSLVATPLVSWTNGRQVAAFTMEGGAITYFSVLEEDTVRTMLLFGGAAFPPLADTAFLGIPGDSFALLDWDADGVPEIAAITQYFGFANLLEIREIGGGLVQIFNLSTPAALFDVLPGTPDRILLADRHGGGADWKIQVLGMATIEVPVIVGDPIAAIAVGYHDQDALPDVAVATALGLQELYVHRPSGPSFAAGEAVFGFQTSGEPVSILVADLDGDGDGELASFDDTNTLTIAQATPVDAGIFMFLPDVPLVDEPIPQPEAEYDFVLPASLDDATHVQIRVWNQDGGGGPILAGTDQVVHADLAGYEGGDPFTAPVLFDYALPDAIVFFHTELRLVQKAGDLTLRAYPAVLGTSDVTFGNPALTIDRFQHIGGGGVIGAGGGMGAERGNFIPIPPEGPLPPFPLP